MISPREYKHDTEHWFLCAKLSVLDKCWKGHVEWYISCKGNWGSVYLFIYFSLIGWLACFVFVFESWRSSLYHIIGDQSLWLLLVRCFVGNELFFLLLVPPSLPHSQEVVLLCKQNISVVAAFRFVHLSSGWVALLRFVMS